MKNQELPLQFFLDYAWKPIPQHRIHDWERGYAAQNFGPSWPALSPTCCEYGKLQSDRKPELLNRRITVDPAKDLATDSSAVLYDDRQTPFSITNYRELERVTDQWQELARRTERLRRAGPAELQDAFYQLVYYQIIASANLYELREAGFTNQLYAQQGRAATNDLADVAEARFAEDQAMSDYYNHTLAGGKWEGFQTQPKIGYGDVERYGPNAPWQQPERRPGAGCTVTVQAVVDNNALVPRGFVEANGYVSMEADHYSRVVHGDGIRWVRIDDIGRSGNGMEPYPLRAPRQTPGGGSPRLEYEVTLKTAGPVRVLAYLSPRNNVFDTDGLKYAVSVDDHSPQTVNITSATGANDTTMNKQWERNTSDNVNLTATTHVIDRPGRHVLKFWMVDPTVVVQKLVIDTGGLLPSYFGPPQSRRYSAV